MGRSVKAAEWVSEGLGLERLISGHYLVVTGHEIRYTYLPTYLPTVGFQ